MRIISSGRGLHSSEFYKKKKKRRRLKIIIFFFISVLFLSALVYAARLERFQIREVVVEGDNIVGRDYIAEVAGRQLLGNYFLVFPRSNALIYPRSMVKENLLAEFPRFKSVDLDLDAFGILVIIVEERESSALYCTLSTSCFFIDENGFIFAPASFASEFNYSVYTTKEPLKEPVGYQLLESEEFTLLVAFMENLANLNIYPTALEISADDYTLSTSFGSKIIWRRGADRALIYTNLEAFLSNEGIASQENFLDRVLYLDLRTDDKVFYKFK